MLLGACGSSEEVDHTGQAQIPSSSMKGRDYMEVMEEFEENGFTNVQSEKIEDLVFGWLTDDGEVEEVLIDGSSDYSKEEWIPDDTEIIVRYHTFENEDEEVANVNEIEETDVTRNVDSETSEEETDADITELPIIEEVAEKTVSEPIETEDSIIEEASVEVKQPAYSYTTLNQTMYASQSVNVRNLPSTDGEKLGGLAYAEEVTVTGQCNETGWYRINYTGNEAYVSNKYLVNEKPIPVEKSSNAGNSSSAGGSSSSGNSVTVPTHEDTVGNLVWVPTKGGKKYHSYSTCSGMEGPMQVTVEHATSLGFTACKRCH